MTDDDIIRWAAQARLPSDYVKGEPMLMNHLKRFASLVAEAEGEACAKECEVLSTRYGNKAMQARAALLTAAGVIRSRGKV